MKNYKNLRAYDAGGDLTKKWFISYYFYNSRSNTYQRIRETGDINRHSDLKERKTALKALLQAKEVLLEKGFSPFETYDKDTMLHKVGLLFQNTDECITKVLEHKKLHIAHTSYTSLRSRIENFRTYLFHRKLLSVNPNEITKRHIMDYLDFRTQNDGISGRTRNNLLIDLKTLFNTMIDLDFIKENPAARVKKVRQVSEKNKFYEKEELENLFELIEKHNPYLMVYCKFIFHSFLRPIEIVRLQVKDIDLKNMVINIPANKAKARVAQSVKIMDILKPVVLEMKLEDCPPDYYIFSSNKKPSTKGTTRDYFTDKFKKAKDELGLSTNHTMYGLKHTGISNLLMNGAKEKDVRKYTRHTSSAFEAYTKRYDMQSPEDLSRFYNLEKTAS